MSERPYGRRPTALGKLAGRMGDECVAAMHAVRSGLVGPIAPHRVPAIVHALWHYGTLGSAVSIAATRFGERVAVIDERGSVTFAELDRRTNALANAWRERGLRAGHGVAVLARNHRGFLDAVFAAAKCGARIILLNADFAGPQIAEVADREGTDLLVHDDEYTPMVGAVRPGLGRWRAWTDDPDPAEDTIEALIAGGPPTAPPRPARNPKVVLLTSGTTGTPKGAPRKDPRSLAVVGGLINRIPFRAGETVQTCSPMFHGLGFASTVLTLEYGSTALLCRRFDAAATLRTMQARQVSTLTVVPVMLRRLLEEGVGGYDLSALRVVFVAGSQLGGELAERALRELGPVVYNLYGSTEVSVTSIATPADLAVAPDTVGRPVRGVTVRLLDQNGHEVPPGQSGRIFVGALDQMESYTGGGGKEVRHGLMCSGDVGHFDIDGRLYIDGRDDEMIVSGGENVFPAEVEEVLVRHPDIVEAAAIGVADERFGQRLRAFVVTRANAQLTADDIRAHVGANLARFKVPRDVIFLDGLPRNPTGKVVKRDLATIEVTP